MGWPTHIVAAGGYVFDSKGNILIVKTHNRGWDCTGGQIEEGENIEDGVLREILEESGVNARIKCLCGIYSNVGKHLFYDGITPVPTKVMMDLSVDELWLVDIEDGKHKLDIIGDLARRMVNAAGLPMKIHTTLDRREALEDADFVTTQLRVGLLNARIKDERIPLSHGLLGQETNGAGGFFY